MKKKSTAVILCAAMLVAGISAVFATSPKPLEPKDIEKLPTAVMSNALPKPPVSASVEKDVSVPDTSAVADLEPAPVEKVTPDTDNRIHPVTDEPAEPVADTAEPAPAEDSADRPIAFYPDDPVEFWGIPEGPIAAETTLAAHTEEEFREMIRQLRSMGYEGFFSLRGHTPGKHIVVLAEDFDGVDRAVKAPDRFMPDWTYHVNSKGETYGSLWDEQVLGYAPDLIAVQAFNGVSGYAFNHEMAYLGYPGPTKTREDRIAYTEWLRTQPNCLTCFIGDSQCQPWARVFSSTPPVEYTTPT